MRCDPITSLTRAATSETGKGGRSRSQGGAAEADTELIARGLDRRGSPRGGTVPRGEIDSPGAGPGRWRFLLDVARLGAIGPTIRSPASGPPGPPGRCWPGWSGGLPPPERLPGPRADAGSGRRQVPVLPEGNPPDAGHTVGQGLQLAGEHFGGVGPVVGSAADGDRGVGESGARLLVGRQSARDFVCRATVSGSSRTFLRARNCSSAWALRRTASRRVRRRPRQA